MELQEETQHPGSRWHRPGLTSTYPAKPLAKRKVRELLLFLDPKPDCKATVLSYLRVPKIDLHDEGHRDPRGKGQAGGDDDSQPILPAAAVSRERVLAGLPERGHVLAAHL